VKPPGSGKVPFVSMTEPNVLSAPVQSVKGHAAPPIDAKKGKLTEDCIDNTDKAIKVAFASFGKGSKPSKTGHDNKCLNKGSLHASTKKASNPSRVAKIVKDLKTLMIA